jgi:hypothetical protein
LFTSYEPEGDVAVELSNTHRQTEWGLLASCGAVAFAFGLVLLAFLVTVGRQHQADDIAGSQNPPVEQSCVRC